MTEAMRELKGRTDDVSEVEQSMKKVQHDMEKNVEENLHKFAEAITRISEDNNTRDRKLEELIKGFSTGLQERDMKIDKKVERLEKQIGTKIDNCFVQKNNSAVLSTCCLEHLSNSLFSRKD